VVGDVEEWNGSGLVGAVHVWRRGGKSDPLDAVSAGRAAQSGRAQGAPKGRDGQVEAIRALMVAKRSATSERTQTINQARALVLTGPDDIRTRFDRHTTAALH
jgi:transposase